MISAGPRPARDHVAPGCRFAHPGCEVPEHAAAAELPLQMPEPESPYVRRSTLGRMASGEGRIESAAASSLAPIRHSLFATRLFGVHAGLLDERHPLADFRLE